MKRNILICALLLGCVCHSFAQDCDIALTPIVSDLGEMEQYPQVETYLTNRLRTLASQTPMGMENKSFAIAVSCDVIDKEIVSGAPSKVVYKLDASLHILDLKGQKVFASHSLKLKGVGDNEQKALMNSFQRLNTNNTAIQSFVQQGKKKIVDYYNQNWQSIIASAKTKASMKNYDAAIYELLCVPECCVGYTKVSEALKQIYQQFVNQHCNENLAQARAAWYSSPNADGASTASVFLSEIYPDAACYGDAMSLYQEIKAKMGELWKFSMKQWNDNVALERQRIEAMTAIGVAYANAQPRQRINVFWKRKTN